MLTPNFSQSLQMPVNLTVKSNAGATIHVTYLNNIQVLCYLVTLTFKSSDHFLIRKITKHQTLKLFQV
jgi:hypothetical protein